MRERESASTSKEQDSAEQVRAWRREQAARDQRDIAESKRVFNEADANVQRMREKEKKKGGAYRDFAEATEFARSQIQSDGLDGEVRPFHEIRYTVSQGLKAAIHGREDGIATLILQRSILLRLDAIKILLWVVIALLLFIAFKIS